MAWSHISTGSAGNSSASDPTLITCNLPGTYAEGDLLLLRITQRDKTDLFVTAPSGYTLLAQDDAGSVTGGVFLYGKIAGSSESAPQYSIDSNSRSSHQMAAFRDSNGVTTLGSIVHALAKGDTANNTNATITYPSLTISVDNTLVLYVVTKSKSVNESTSVDTVSGFTELGEDRPAFASSQVSAWGYQIQTTASSITGSTVALTTTTESSSLAERAVVVSLLSTAPSTQNFQYQTRHNTLLRM